MNAVSTFKSFNSFYSATVLICWCMCSHIHLKLKKRYLIKTALMLFLLNEYDGHCSTFQSNKTILITNLMQFFHWLNVMSSVFNVGSWIQVNHFFSLSHSQHFRWTSIFDSVNTLNEVLIMSPEKFEWFCKWMNQR